ncbi:MIP/aquaporin family protein [Curtobacterium ammoniigenes]|uniref:MIP/aquaporin family protein n=1 Tax=Curtobacterium ammoniigenes TaxID=395387 RepID=UPI0008366BED|nr:aquaporin [Curtobacterium ammoniigenes]
MSARQLAHPNAPRHPRAAHSGWHWTEWWCEFAGTGILMLLGLSAVCFDFGSASPLAGWPTSLRFLLTGTLFGGIGSGIALTPIGRRSGAHLNPIVTLGFFGLRKVHWHDLVGYIAGQVLGAIAGTAIFRLLWQHQATTVSDGATQPGAHVPWFAAVALEAGMSAVLLLAILFMTSGRRTARWTPLIVWIVVAVFVWQFARFTGTSMNPARSLAPALIAPALASYWIYVVGPLLGAGIALGVFALTRDVDVLTTKLFHDERYPTTMTSALPAADRDDHPDHREAAPTYGAASSSRGHRQQE